MRLKVKRKKFATLAILSILIILYFIVFIFSTARDSDTANISVSKTVIKGELPLRMIISPSTGEVVRGIITLELKDTPKMTEYISFGIEGEKIPGRFQQHIMDSEKGDGWCISLDTRRYKDGTYEIYGWIFVENSNNGLPLDYMKAKIVVQCKN